MPKKKKPITGKTKFPGTEFIAAEDIPARKKAHAARKADTFARSAGGLGARLRDRRKAVEMGDPSGGSKSNKTGKLVMKKKKKK